MFQTLETIRTLPPEKRKLIAFGISLFFTGIVFIMWLSVKNNTSKNQVIISETNQYAESNFFIENISRMWANAYSSFGEMTATLNSINISPTIQYQATSTDVTEKTQ